MTNGANDDSSETDGAPRPEGPRHDPYADVAIAELPAWWRQAIEHFEARGIDPYRPPRLADGTLKRDVQRALESELDVDISFRCKNATVGDDWTITVDEEPVETVGRHRSRDRYTVYELTADEFRGLIRSAVKGE